MRHTKDIGRAIASLLDSQDHINEFDWDADVSLPNGNNFTTYTDASNGHDNLIVWTDGDIRFRVTVTRID